MKKNFLLGFIAFAAMAVTSCTNDEMNEFIPQDEAIEFSTYVGRDAQSRAEETKLVTLQEDGFGVFAYLNVTSANYQNANFMKNIKVDDTDNNSVWDYTPAKYWPKDENNKLDFLAYGPFGSANITELTQENKHHQFKFTVNNAVVSQTDLVVATPLKNQTKSSNSGNVQFTFDHMLSRITFSAVTISLDNVASVIINSVKFKGTFAKTATVDIAAKTLTPTTEEEVTYTFAKGTDFTETEATLSLTASELNNEKTNYLMVIPNATNQTVTITVNYTITYLDGTAPVSNEISKDITSQTFAAGKAYKYALSVAADKIMFTDPIVTAWGNETNVPNEGTTLF